MSPASSAGSVGSCSAADTRRAFEFAEREETMGILEDSEVEVTGNVSTARDNLNLKTWSLKARPHVTATVTPSIPAHWHPPSLIIDCRPLITRTTSAHPDSTNPLDTGHPLPQLSVSTRLAPSLVTVPVLSIENASDLPEHICSSYTTLSAPMYQELELFCGADEARPSPRREDAL